MVTHISTRYFILIHHDYNYLKKCLQEIKEYLMTINLKLNQKTAIYSFYNGFTFLGYRFLTKRNRIYVLASKKMEKKIKKCFQKDGELAFLYYNGYLKECDNYNFLKRKIIK